MKYLPYLTIFFLCTTSSLYAQNTLLILETSGTDTVALHVGDNIKASHLLENKKRKSYGRILAMTDSTITIKKALRRQTVVLRLQDILVLKKTYHHDLFIAVIPACILTGINLFLTPISPLIIAGSVPVSSFLYQWMIHRPRVKAPLSVQWMEELQHHPGSKR